MCCAEGVNAVKQMREEFGGMTRLSVNNVPAFSLILLILSKARANGQGMR